MANGYPSAGCKLGLTGDVSPATHNPRLERPQHVEKGLHPKRDPVTGVRANPVQQTVLTLSTMRPGWNLFEAQVCSVANYLLRFAGCRPRSCYWCPMIRCGT